jgi:hypothetical protein
MDWKKYLVTGLVAVVAVYIFNRVVGPRIGISL